MLKKIYDFQNGRVLWFCLWMGTLVLVLIAHLFFQNYLFMPPCEQCVYVRFAFLCITLGSFLAFINPKSVILKGFAFVFIVYGSIKGILYSYKLNLIHEAIRSENPFGFEGCSMTPSYPFGLPLHEWLPSLFLPTGDCGFDNPVIPSGESLNFIQQYFTNLYADGWYLFPSSHFINMAQVCLVVFCLILFCLFFIAISIGVKKFIKN